ncbi:glucokinase [Asticcacaulis machinosus]|uniref:Glucokinase n=1 Tax=Asticcacaulis machinosus TaxID=2984211 RepID=A0ABT5HMP5_9CAUL|nr:glucokinase [Asticcacaulis machinosus]MDC7676869.1 glucokinase [Asticcacaulis machinosus]
MVQSVLLSDISSGDYLKLALARPGERPGAFMHYTCSSLDEFNADITEFLSANGNPRLRGAAFSTSGWETNGVVELVRYGFHLKRADIRNLLGIQRLNIVNNLVAKALAVPQLEPHEREKLFGGDATPDQPIAVIGPEHGLGVALLVPDGMGNWTAMPSEGGHTDLSATNAEEAAVLALMVQKFGHVSRERAVSIAGLAEIWRCLAVLDKDDVATPPPEEIVARAYAEDERSKRAIAISLGWYAAMASDTALMMGARGGIYLSGGIGDLVGDLFDLEAFAARFYDKGRVISFLKGIPVYRTKASEMEILGLTTLFDPDLMPV